MNDPLLRVFEKAEEDKAIGDTVPAEEAVQEDTPVVTLIPEELEVVEATTEPEPTPTPKKTTSKKVPKKTAKRKTSKKAKKTPKKTLKELVAGREVTSTQLISESGCTLADIREACANGELKSVYTKDDSGTLQFRYTE
jgi:outer membrane biosynthesis protein TonB